MLVKFADVTFDIKTSDDKIISFFNSYSSNDEPKFSISITDEDIEYEKSFNSLNTTNYSLTLIAIYRKIVEELINYDAVLFHSSALIVDDKGLIITGESGIGKSTHASLYREYLNATMINDDKPLIRMFDNEFVVYGTPYDGKHHLSNNISHPINAIFSIKQGQNSIKKLNNREALEVLMSQVYRPKNEEKLLKVINIMNRMANNIAIYELTCDISKEALKTGYKVL